VIADATDLHHCTVTATTKHIERRNLSPPTSSKMASYPDSASSSHDNDEGWQDDVAEDLNTFVRLSKAGHFTRAEDFFRAFLESHAGDFAVDAQYAENLIEQGSFGSAETFLDAWLSNDKDADDDERLVLRLLLATARLYTQFDVIVAESTAVFCLKRVGEVLIAENMSPLKVSDREQDLNVEVC
jgi:hypothetical protein